MAEKHERKATVYEEVSMEDGRTIKFPGARKVAFDQNIGASTATVIVNFRNGVVRECTIPDKFLVRFAAQGMQNALTRLTGVADELDDAVNAVDEYMVKLNSGVWPTRSAEVVVRGGSILFKALCIAAEGKRTPEQVKEFLASKSAAQKAQIRHNPQIAPIVAKIQAEIAARKAARLEAKGENVPGSAALDELLD